MKPLLRKLFFWDAPAKGAFFSLTLLIVLQRCFWPIVYGVGLPAFLRNDSIGLTLFCVELFLGAVLVIYSLVCLFHFCLKKAFSKVSAVIVFVCAMLILAVLAFFPEHLKAETTVFLFLFIFWGLVYSFHPVVKIHDWLLAVVPLLVGAALHFNLETASIQSILQSYGSNISPKCDFFHLFGYGHLWLPAICCIALLAAGYLLGGRVIAKAGALPFRKLFGKGVATLWIVFALMYLASVVMAWQAMHSYRKAKMELDSFWGVSINNKSLDELYRKSGRIDQSFWDELIGLKVEFPELNEQYDGLDAIVSVPNTVLPPEINEQWKSAFAESPELKRCEEMLNEPPPLPERGVGFNHGKADLAIISKCRIMARLELWSVRLALEANDILSAQKALRRMDNITSSLLNDYGYISHLVWWAIEFLRADALSQIIASGLADEKWLSEQAELMLEKESHIQQMHKRAIMGYASSMIETIDNWESSIRGLFLFYPESFMLLGWEGAAVARCHLINDFSDFPQKPKGIFPRELAAGLRYTGTIFMPETLATFRISRGMVMAELMRRKNGQWPDKMDDLPTDPFSHKPLQYTVGKCEIPEEHFQPNDDQDQFNITPELQKQFGMTDEQTVEFAGPEKYTFKTEWRTVDAVQIWSVGPNGINDGGLRSTDDIRFIIPIK